jgi:hypothetical protein
MSQSSNDVFPTAMHIAAARESTASCCRRSSALRDALARKAKEFADDRQDRPHPPAGRDAAHARPGILRLRRAARARHRAHVRAALPQLCELALGGTAVGTGLNAPPSSPRVAGRVASSRAAVRHGAEQVRGAGLARRAGVRARRAEDARRVAVQDRQRHPLLALGPALRARRAQHCPRTSRAARSCRARSTRRSARR